MARGGKRQGAGRKPGSVTQRTRAIADAMLESGELTPLDYLKSVYQNTEADEAKRIDAAKAAAPYVHPRLNSVEHSGPGGESVWKPLNIGLYGVKPGEA